MFFKKTKINFEKKLDEISFYIKNTNQTVYDLSYSMQEVTLLKTKVEDLEKQNIQLQKNYKDLLESYKKSELLRERAYDVLAKLATAEEVSKLATAEEVSKLATAEEVSKLATAEEVSKLATLEENQRIIQIDNTEKKINNRINDNYKKIRYKLYKFMDKENWEQATIDDAFEVTRKAYDLNNPQTLNEKVCWLKLFDRRPIMTTIADKYAVRDYIIEKTGSKELLVDLLGVYDNFDQINFDKLPEQFVIKTNHGSGYNLICKDKSSLNINETKKTVENWLAQDFAYVALEPHYLGIEKKILIEKYMENGDTGLDDYKIFCFNGKPCVIFYITGRFTKKQCAFYDTEWNRLPYTNDGFENMESDIKRPSRLDDMLLYAEKLSEDFTVARVDFYVLDSGDIKLGEITLTPAAGRSRLSENANIEMGKMIKLPDIVPSVYKKN